MGPGGFNKEGKVNSVFLKDMPFILDVGRDAWHRDGKTQPVNITLRVDHVNSIQDAAASDDISQSLDYGKLYKNIQRSLDNHKPHCNVRTIAGNILPCIQTSGVTGSVQIDLPKAALRAEGGLRYTLEQNTNPESVDQYEALRISDIKCACIIGVNRHERRDKQMVIVHLSFINDAQPSSLPAIARSQVPATVIAVDNYHDIIDGVAKRVEESSYQTVEALANHLCKFVITEWEIPEVEVSVEKPYAIPSIGAAGVCIRRRTSFYKTVGV